MTAVSGHRIRMEIAEVTGFAVDDPRVIELHRRSCDWVEAMRSGLRAVIEDQRQELSVMRLYSDARRDAELDAIDTCAPDQR